MPKKTGVKRKRADVNTPRTRKSSGSRKRRKRNTVDPSPNGRLADSINAPFKKLGVKCAVENLYVDEIKDTAKAYGAPGELWSKAMAKPKLASNIKGFLSQLLQQVETEETGRLQQLQDLSMKDLLTHFTQIDGIHVAGDMMRRDFHENDVQLLLRKAYQVG